MWHGYTSAGWGRRFAARVVRMPPSYTDSESAAFAGACSSKTIRCWLSRARRLKSKARFFPGGAPDAGTYAYRLSRQEHSSGWTGRSDA